MNSEFMGVVSVIAVAILLIGLRHFSLSHGSTNRSNRRSASGDLPQ